MNKLQAGACRGASRRDPRGPARFSRFPSRRRMNIIALAAKLSRLIGGASGDDD
jgi:hypothetical protein